MVLVERISREGGEKKERGENIMGREKRERVSRERREKKKREERDNRIETFKRLTC